MKLGICGNISLEPLAVSVDTVLPQSDIIVGKTDSHTKELIETPGEFAFLDACILALDWRPLLPLLYNFGYGDDVLPVQREIEEAFDTVGKALRKFRIKTPAKVLVFSPISDCLHPMGFLSRFQKDSPFDLFMECQRMFVSLCRSIPDAYILDADEMSRLIGFANTYDEEQSAKTQMPFSPQMLSCIATRIADMLKQFDASPIKCLVLDCDNTLWGGIAGESGALGITLSDSGEGKAYKDLQKEIVKLYKQGIILAINSKNNTCDALEIFEQHPHMMIRPPMISCFRINWDDKPKNMLQIAEELNIGLDAILFIDDSPAERALMQSALPQVCTFALPASPFAYANALKSFTRIWPTQLTIEDRNKSLSYATQRNRVSAQALAKNVEEFLVNSNIRVSIQQAEDAVFPRIAQLFAKTNQFNLTTKRYSESQLREIAHHAGNRLIYMRMQDNYGDYGIIGCACIMGDNIDSFILSCRAFGKHAETALLSHCIRLINATQRKPVYGLYISTIKNGMTKDFYKNHGFVLQQTAENVQRWRLDESFDIPKTPHWISTK